MADLIWIVRVNIEIGDITPIMNVLAIIAGVVLLLERWFSEGGKIMDHVVYVDAIAMEIE